MAQLERNADEYFMNRAMELARLGTGYVSPNPLVGSVVVHNGQIIGEGWHRRYGSAHAEVNALRSVDDKKLLSESVLYVNLEPCSHHGKTPPCADLIIEHNIKKVVVANVDSNPLVSGSGIRKLRDAGIEVATGILEEEGRRLNKRFFTWIEKERPYVILKWAQTADGFVARENYDSKWISNEYSRQIVHKWRTEEDGVMVGTRTVQEDNPQLNVRDWSGRNPVRIVIDRFLKLSKDLHVFDKSQRTICYNLFEQKEEAGLQFIRFEEANFLRSVMDDLYRQKIQSVIIEGGAQTLNYFIQAGMWDEARIFTSVQAFGKGIDAPKIVGKFFRQDVVMDDILTIYHRP